MNVPPPAQADTVHTVRVCHTAVDLGLVSASSFLGLLPVLDAGDSDQGAGRWLPPHVAVPRPKHPRISLLTPMA